MRKIKAGGGVIYCKKNTDSGPEVLLIYRRGRWDLPKGKLEEGETIEECAAREVAEETGLAALPEIDSLLTTTYHEYEQEGRKYGKTTYWYAMQLAQAQQLFEPQAEEGIGKVEWYSIKEAAERVDYENLVDVLNVLEKKR